MHFDSRNRISERFTTGSSKGTSWTTLQTILTSCAPLLDHKTMAACDQWAPVFRVRTCARSPTVSICSIWSLCRFRDLYFAPLGAHWKSCATKFRFVVRASRCNISIGLLHLRKMADPKHCARAPLGQRHGGVLRKRVRYGDSQSITRFVPVEITGQIVPDGQDPRKTRKNRRLLDNAPLYHKVRP